MGGITIQQLTGIGQWIARAQPLLEAHREELTTNPDLMVLAPRVDVYEAIEARDKLLVLGAFDGEDLVGYSANIIDTNLHYGDVLVCQNDVLFVDRAYRAGRTGLQLIRATEDLARALSCDIMIWHAKPNTTFNALLPRLDYRVQDVIHSKVL